MSKFEKSFPELSKKAFNIHSLALQKRGTTTLIKSNKVVLVKDVMKHCIEISKDKPKMDVTIPEDGDGKNYCKLKTKDWKLIAKNTYQTNKDNIYEMILEAKNNLKLDQIYEYVISSSDKIYKVNIWSTTKALPIYWYTEKQFNKIFKRVKIK